jgi:hypothetical protein
LGRHLAPNAIDRFGHLMNEANVLELRSAVKSLLELGPFQSWAAKAANPEVLEKSDLR